MQSSTRLIFYGILGFFVIRVLGKSTEKDGMNDSGDTVVVTGGSTTTSPSSQWLVAYSMMGVSDVVWNYQRPYQWTPSGVVTSWDTYFLIGNRSHTGFTSSSTGGNPNGIYTQIDVNGVQANAYFNLSEAVAQLQYSNAPKDPNGPSTPPPSESPNGGDSWSPNIPTGFGFSSPAGPQF